MQFRPIEFTPTSSNFAGKKISGVGIELTNRENFSAMRLGTELGVALGTLYPGKINWAVNRRLIGSERVIEAFMANRDASRPAEEGLAEFLALREKYLLYH